MPAITTVTINANVEWAVGQSNASKRVVAVCDALNICLEADSHEELESLIPEAMHLLLKDLLADNEFDQFLQARGWQAVNVPQRPVRDIRFDLPWHMIAREQQRGAERRAH